MSEKNKGRSPEFEILQYIKENPTGVSLTEISKKKGVSRSNVSKYVKLLGFEKKIYRRKIGCYKMYFSTKTSRDAEAEILDYIREKPSGVTITEISTRKGFSRNTVSKYVSILLLKKLIKKKKIGAFHIYFCPEIYFYSKLYILSYYKALLAGVKKNYPNDGEVFKEIGRKSLKYLDFFLKHSSSKKLKSIRYNRILKLYYDVFGKFSPTLNTKNPIIELSVKKTPKGKIDTLILKFANSEFLDDSNEFIYHFYISAGIIEEAWKREVNKSVKCDIETIHISEKKEYSFIELSIKINST